MESFAAQHKADIVGPAVGQFLYLLAKISVAQNVFEMDPGIGYSTAWLARAMKENGGGTVHHVVPSEDHSMKAQQHILVMGLHTYVKYHVGNPTEALREVDGRLDMIFMDMDVREYEHALTLVRDRLKPNGFLVANNVLAGGGVIDGKDNSPQTEAVRTFTRLITKDPTWTCSLIPIHKGLLLAQKR